MRSHRIWILDCFLQRLRNVCCDVTLDRLWVWFVSVFLPNITPLLLFIPWTLSRKTPLIRRTISSMSLKYTFVVRTRFTLPILLELIRGFYSHVYAVISFSVLSLFLTLVLLTYRCSSFMGLDHQSPKRVSLRAFSTCPSISLLTLFFLGLDMENSLDSSQDSISLLPVSLCDVLIISYIHQFTLY